MNIAERNRRRARDWSDVLIASDPGLVRLVRARSVAVGIGVTIAAEYGFAQLAHPFWDGAPVAHMARQILRPSSPRGGRKVAR